jgi:hypothetical protein
LFLVGLEGLGGGRNLLKLLIDNGEGQTLPRLVNGFKERGQFFPAFSSLPWLDRISSISALASLDAPNPSSVAVFTLAEMPATSVLPREARRSQTSTRVSFWVLTVSATSTLVDKA